MKFKKPKLDNFRYLLISSSMGALVGGIFGPFYVLYLQKIGGGFENFGFAYGLFAIAASVTSYVVGKYSDRFGRKPFMILTNFVYAIILVSYTFVTSVAQLFALQILFGITDSTWKISETAFLGDITKKKHRGRVLGKYNMVLGMLSGITMLFSGILVSRMGFEIIFYLMAATDLVSAIPLFFIKER
jgi:MFS family permease